MTFAHAIVRTPAHRTCSWLSRLPSSCQCLHTRQMCCRACQCGAGHSPRVPSSSWDAHAQASSPPQLASLEPPAAASNLAAAAGGAVTPLSQQAVSSHPLRELSPNGSVADVPAAAGGGSALLTPRGTQEVHITLMRRALHASPSLLPSAGMWMHTLGLPLSASMWLVYHQPRFCTAIPVSAVLQLQVWP